MKTKLTVPILYVIMLYEFYIEDIIRIITESKITSESFALKIICFKIVVRVIIWTITVRQAVRNKEDEEFLRKSLIIAKFVSIPFFVINFVYSIAMGAIITIGTLGGATLIYIIVAMILTWLIMAPGIIYGVSLNKIKFDKNIISKNTMIKLNILQFIFILDVFSSILSLTKYKDKSFN